jgi:hypothetical protein
MRQPPSNPNVQPGAWQRAIDEHRDYLRRHKQLMEMALTEQEADQYLDAWDLVNRQLNNIDPDDVDFCHSDHKPTFKTLQSALAQMHQCLEIGAARYNENWKKANSR